MTETPVSAVVGAADTGSTPVTERTEDDLRVFASDGAGEEVGAESTHAELGASAHLSPEDYAAEFRMAISLADLARPRSLQSDEGTLGASDALGCANRAVYVITRTPPSDVAKKGAALIGTALHEVWLPQMQAMNPDLLIEQSLLLTLPSGAQIPVHPDLIDPNEPSVTDLKTTASINVLRRQGPEHRHLVQVSLYYLAALQAGLIQSDTGLIRILYVSRADADDVFVHSQPFSMALVHEADEWFEQVRQAVLNNEEGERTGAPHYCRSYCGFYSLCKPVPVDAQGQLVSPGLRELVRTTAEATVQRKFWEKIEKEAKVELRGVNGQVDDLTLISTKVNGARPHERVDIR